MVTLGVLSLTCWIRSCATSQVLTPKAFLFNRFCSFAQLGKTRHNLIGQCHTARRLDFSLGRWAMAFFEHRISMDILTIHRDFMTRTCGVSPVFWQTPRVDFINLTWILDEGKIVSNLPSLGSIPMVSYTFSNKSIQENPTFGTRSYGFLSFFAVMFHL